MLSACEREAPPAGSPARGRALFQAHCVLCHGERADGRGARAFGLSRPPADFTSARWRAGASEARVLHALAQGVPGTPMPAWPSLSPDERRDLAAYVLSVAGERRP